MQQNRSDLGPRRIQVVVQNASETDFAVDAVTLRAQQFVAPATADDRRTTVAAGRTVNIPLQLPAADCSVAEPVTEVLVDFADGEGGRVRASVEPADPFDRLPQLRQEDCLQEAVDSVARLTIDRLPELRTVAGTTIASLPVDVTPTGSAGSFTVESVAGTTLVAVADPSTGAIVPEGAIGADVEGSDAPSSFVVTLVPNRCDPHAIAEDKRGSILPFRVSTSPSSSGQVFVAASDEVRAALYAFVRSACGG